MKKIKVAVIGTGHLGKIHARIYNEMPGVDLVGICDTNEEKADSYALQFKSSAYIDYKKLFDKVDAVSIATPTITHFKIARDFLNHNVHVLVEKPITPTMTEAQKLVKIARAKKNILQVGHVERFNPAITTIQGFCKNPKFIECHRLSPYPKRGTDVSVILDLMIHDIDIVLSLVKSPLKQTHAIGVNVLSANEDIASVRLIFKNGTVCNLTASRVSDEGMRKIRIFQKDSYLSLDYAEQKIIYYKKENNMISKEEISVKKKQPLVEELSSFIDCIKKGKQPIVRGKEGKDALEIALAITKQIRKNA